MGYTHYWDIRRDGDQHAWGNALMHVHSIIEASPVPLDVEYADDAILINGVGEDGHETLVLPTVLAEMEPDPDHLKPQSTPANANWGFCKTARKPYDVVVTAILATLETLAPHVISVTSDGQAHEWAAGIELAREATGIQTIRCGEYVRAA